ncbi:P-loop NTPase fold protein [Pseudomonas mosselii]|uniref:P-loop NTPase fold protein n=1 Tax=Pseudomonas mosselii TaxID=78327 RepID=UPI001BD36398|nr:P-loop NTPase fold protein [Pseudomonas mosselii]MBS9760903.1 hypothetical protein [Pseudomonas mosselii]
MHHLDSYLDNFLHGHSDVVVLKGNWGVGKTRYWNDYINNKRQSEHERLEKYSYVSLYGLNSIDQVRSKIYHGAECWSGEQNLSTTLSKDEEQSRLSKFLDYLEGKWQAKGERHETVPGLNRLSAALNAFSHSRIDNYLICFDDLERKGEKLELRELMGLIDELSQQRACKILVIFNEGALAEKDVRQYEENKEKVIDTEFLYEPDIGHNLGVVFKPGDFCFEEVRFVCEAFELSNIRILKKIKRMLDVHQDAFIGCKAQVVTDFGRHASLLTWAYFSMEGTQDIKDLKRRILSVPLSAIKLDQPDEKVSANCRELYRALSSSGMRDTKFRTPIVRYLERGAPELQGIRSIREGAESVVSSQADRDAWDRVWQLYENSFSDDEDEIISLLQGLMQSGYLTNDNLGEFLKAIRLLVVLGVNIDGWVEKFIEQNQSVFERGGYDGWRDIGNERLVTAIATMRRESKVSRLSLDDILENIVRHGVWREEELKDLQYYTADEMYDWLKVNDRNKARRIRRGLSVFGRYKQSHPEKHEGVDHVLLITKQAFTRLAAESPLNKLRVDEFYSFTVTPFEPVTSSEK